MYYELFINCYVLCNMYDNSSNLPGFSSAILSRSQLPFSPHDVILQMFP